MRPSRTHYDTLGVAPDATATAIRDAYRELARRFHPDRVASSAAGADRMPEVNEAYRVLSDPGRRAVYDATLRDDRPRRGDNGEPSTGRSDRFDGHDDDYAWRLRESQRPVRVPWRSIMVCAGVLIVLIVVLAQFTDGTDEPVIDGILRVGDCAEVLDDGRASEVPCSADGVGDLVVESMIPFDQRCEFGQSRHQDRQGMGNVCLAGGET
ncbi:MAG: J domain-containing protein [Actinomycetota bacterium]